MTLAALASGGTALAAGPAPGNGDAIFRDAGTDPNVAGQTPPADPGATAPATTTDTTATPPPPVTTSTPVPPPPAPTTTATTPTPATTAPAVSTHKPKPAPRPHPAHPSHPAKPAPAQPDNSAADHPDKAKGKAKPKKAAKKNKKAKDDTAANALLSPETAPVPDLLLQQFDIPPFLLPVYQAAATAYQVPWTVLAAINSVETDYGRNVAVSSAGAVGWMQFMPATWKLYGVDANLDGHRDPYNPADAVFAAARYLHAAGADTDLRAAVFAYNHSDAYVAEVMSRAEVLSKLPTDLVDSLTGLAQARFPIPGPVRVQRALGPRKWTILHANANRRVIAPSDGQVISLGTNARLGRFVVVEDAYGNRFTYAHLGALETKYAVPRERAVTHAQIARELHLPHHDPKPKRAASAGTLRHTLAHVAHKHAFDKITYAPVSTKPVASVTATVEPSLTHDLQVLHRLEMGPTAAQSHRAILAKSIGLKPRQVELKTLKPGAHVVAGTILGYVGYRSPGHSAPVHFAVRPAGHATPRVDARPLLRGWRLLRTTAAYGPAGSSTLDAGDGRLGLGQTLLMDKAALGRKVLDDKRIQIYECGRQDIESGQVDRRVLATLEFLADSGLYPTVSALKCGHSLMTTSGNISEHSTGDAVDIAAINGIPIVGHQGAGTITDTTIRKLLTLQGTMKPHQIISLMTFPGTDNTLALPDHYDHIHVGFHYDGTTPGVAGVSATTGPNSTTSTSLEPDQWNTLMSHLRHVDEPHVSTHVSRFALRAKKHHKRAGSR